jgi:hypothetical protein
VETPTVLLAVSHPFGLPWTPDEANLVAASLTALATIALACLTVWVIRANSDLVKAAQEEAKASAATVTEMQRDQELAARPYLISTWERSIMRSLDESPAQIDIVVKNIGRGPAIRCQFVAWFF